MSENLKKCPFCNGQATFVESLSDVWIVCEECGAGTGVFGTKEDAVAAWNNRPLEDENKRLREALEFYARGGHLVDADECDPACDAYDRASGQIENGWFARETLEKEEN